MFDLSKILNIVRAVAVVTPEFSALVNAVSELVSSADQEALKSALSEAQQRSDLLHAQVQNAAAQAT